MASIVRLTAVLGTAVLLATGVGACSSGPPTVDKPVYLSRADSICQATRDEVARQLGEALAPGNDQGAQERVVRARIVPALKNEVAALQSLGYPKDDATYLTSIYTDMVHLADLIDEQPSQYLGAGFTEQEQSLTKRLRNYGLTTCDRARPEPAAPDGSTSTSTP